MDQGGTLVTQNLVTCRLDVAPLLIEGLESRVAGCRCLIFNLCDSSKEAFQNPAAAANYNWKTASPKSPLPTTNHLISIVYGVSAWLHLSTSNKALVVCDNGKARSSIVVAAFLKFSGSVPTFSDGLIQFFGSCRPPERFSPKEICSKPLLGAFARNFDTLVDSRHYPHPSPYCLEGIVIEGLYVEDEPDVEVWIDSKCIYRSIYSEQEASDFDYDSATALYRVNNLISGEVAVIVRQCDVAADDGSECDSDESLGLPGNDVIFRFVPNTGFLTPGSNEVNLGSISICHPDDVEFFDDDFRLCLLVDRCPGAFPRLQDVVYDDQLVALKGIAEIAERHSVSANPELVTQLTEKFVGASPDAIQLSLQLSSNNLNSAIDFLQEQNVVKLFVQKNYHEIVFDTAVASPPAASSKAGHHATKQGGSSCSHCTEGLVDGSCSGRGSTSSDVRGKNPSLFQGGDGGGWG